MTRTKLLTALLIIGLLFIPVSSLAYTPIARDATSTGAGGSSVSTLDWSHTTSGTNRLLVCGVVQYDGLSVTSMSYNSVAMTLLHNESGDGNVRLTTYYLLNPATGANTLHIVFNSATTFPSGVCESFTGVLQSGFPDAQTSGGNNNASSRSASVTTVLNQAVTVGFFAANGGSIAGGTDTTEDKDNADHTIGVYTRTSALAQTPPGTVTLEATFGSGVNNWSLASFGPADPPAPGGGGCTRCIKGIGRNH